MMQQAMKSAVDVISNFPPERCALLRTTSRHFAEVIDSSDKQLDFIFIDGDHSYERCYEDLNLWYDLVRPNGLFSGHDYSLPGVNKAIADFRKSRNIKGFFKVIPNDVWYWIKD
jgi:predicted O-methyltransferase YrrM